MVSLPIAWSADHPFYDDFRKRSIYLPVVRNMLPDVLALFDMADPNGVTTVRNDTTVPSQSLFLLNSPFVRGQAKHFAQRLLGDAPATDDDRVQRAHALVLARGATAAELAEAREFLAAVVAKTKDHTAAWQSYCQMLFCQNEFLYCE